MTLTKHEEEDALVVDVTLRNLPPLAPFTIQWSDSWIFERSDLDPNKLKKAPGRQSKYNAQDLLDALGHDELTDTEWRTRVREQCGMKDAETFYKYRDQLKKAGRVYPSALNQKWSKTSNEIERSRRN